MKRLTTLALPFVLSIAAIGAATAQTPGAAASAAPVEVTHAWARASTGSGKTSAAYVTLMETGTATDRLVGASTPVAGTAEPHETINDNGVMKMRPTGPIALAPGERVTFAPGGLHIMLMDLKRPLKTGDSFPLTLTFEHASPVTVQVEIARPGASEAEGAGHDRGSMPGMKMDK